MTEDTGNTAGKKGMKLARYDLIPAYPLWKLAEVYGRGAQKYADRNWERGVELEKLFGAMQRHAWQWQAGEDVDPVDGQLHLASVAWMAFAIMELLRTHPELDNRPHIVLEQEPQSLQSEVTNQAEIDAAKDEVKVQPVTGVREGFPFSTSSSDYQPDLRPMNHMRDIKETHAHSS